MIPKQAIEKAIEGGWIPRPTTAFAECTSGYGDFTREYYGIALDPSFWQCLGKALGWVDGCGEENHIAGCEYLHAHRFYDLVLTGGDTEAFWRDLLKTI